MGEYYELLRHIQDDILWKIVLIGDDKTVLNQQKTGFFEELTQTECRMQVRGFEQLQYATPNTVAMLVSGLLEDADRIIDPALFRLARSRIIGFKNGVFDLQLGKMRAYASSDFVLSPLPHIIPERIDADVEKWFMNVLTEWVTPDVSDWFADVLAYFLFIHPNSENLWMNFFEAGRNGKSSCLKLLEKIVGDDKAIGADLAHINRFSNATFQGKWLILGRDSSSFVSDGATSFIKNYSGDEKALVEVKGGNSFDTYTTGKIIVSTNNLIQSKDRSFGWYRRLIPVPFPNCFALNEDFEKNLFKQIPQIIRILLHRAYCYRQNKIPVSQYLPEPVAKLKEETRYLNDRVIAFWELNFFEKVTTDQGVQAFPVVNEFLKIHNKPMSVVYAMYENWHHTFFGDGNVEPSLKSFGGPYGAFLTHAKEYFRYSRKRDGRYIELHKPKLEEFIRQAEPSQQEIFYKDPDVWQMPD
jgi:phage/plasmid-associated DNA primase